MIEKLDWYALRWKIAIFHKILKSGCRAEDSKLRSAERLANLIAILCILAWRMLWLCMVNRVLPELQATQTRFASVDGPNLVLHDTTEFSFTRSDTQAIGQTRKVVAGVQKKGGRPRMHTMCGSVRAFCEREGLTTASLYTWRRTIADRGGAAASRPAFVPAVEADDPGGEASTVVKVSRRDATIVSRRATHEAKAPLVIVAFGSR